MAPANAQEDRDMDESKEEKEHKVEFLPRPDALD